MVKSDLFVYNIVLKPIVNVYIEIYIYFNGKLQCTVLFNYVEFVFS